MVGGAGLYIRVAATGLNVDSKRLPASAQDHFAINFGEFNIRPPVAFV
jgi:hypothetical protein